MNDGEDNEAPRPKYTLKEKSIERVNRPRGVSDQEPLEVSRMLRQNLDVSPEQGALPEPPPKRTSRRLFDYGLVMLLGNGVLGALYAWFPKNVFVDVPLLAGAVVFSVGVTWVMWVVMDKY